MKRTTKAAARIGKLVLLLLWRRHLLRRKRTGIVLRRTTVVVLRLRSKLRRHRETHVGQESLKLLQKLSVSGVVLVLHLKLLRELLLLQCGQSTGILLQMRLNASGLLRKVLLKLLQLRLLLLRERRLLLLKVGNDQFVLFFFHRGEDRSVVDAAPVHFRWRRCFRRTACA